MAKQTQVPEQTVPLGFPLKGIDVECAFDLQPPMTTPVANNVRGFEPQTLRERGGSRSGLVKFADQLPTGNAPLQHLQFIVDPQAEFTIADTDEPVHFGGGLIIGVHPLPLLDYIDDPSTNNLKTRNNGRLVPRRGSGRPSRKTIPSITRATVTLTWDDPADISHGTALDATQLNAVATSGILAVPGTFVYTPDSGTVLGVGDHQGLRVEFTPTDEGFYKSAKKTVHINVTEGSTGKAVTINWSNPANIDDETPLSGTQLNATATHPIDGAVAGTFTYNPVSGTLLSAGVHVLSVHFVPTDTVTYATPADKTVSITVTSAGGGGGFAGTIVVSFDDLGFVGPGTLACTVAPVPPNTQLLIDEATASVGLPTNAFVTDGFQNDGQFIGLQWDEANSRWEYTV